VVGVKYQKHLLSGEVIAQKIKTNSYTSMNFVLSKEGWIPEGVFAVTSVSSDDSYTINTNGYGRYSYRKLYDAEIPEGIYIRKDSSGAYRVAKPLRALCDLICLYRESWKSIVEICDDLRISPSKFEKIRKKDLEELQGKFRIANVENMLDGIRRDLRL